MKRILTIIFILSSFVTFGQWTPMTAKGYQYKGVKVDSLMLLPADTIKTKFGIAQIGSNLFTGNGVSWSSIGGNLDTTSLSNRINTKVTTGSEAVLTGIKASTSAGISIKANNGTEVAHFGAGGGVNANIGNLSIGTAISFNGKRLADTTDLAPFATTTSVNTALGLKADKNTTLTINGVTQDLSTNRSWTVSGGPQVGTYATRIAIASPTVGQQFYQTDIFEGLYTWNGTYWKRDITGKEIDCEFESLYQLAYNGLTTGVSGTGAAANNYANYLYDAQGALRLETGTTTTGYARITIANFATGLSTQRSFDTLQQYYYEYRVFIPTLNDGTNDFIIKIGNDQSVNGNTFLSGFGFIYSNTSNNWQIYSSPMGTNTQTATTVTATANTWVKLAMRQRFNLPSAFPNTTIDFFINDVLVGSQTQRADVITAVTPVTVAIHKVSGNTNRTVLVDYIKYYKLK